LLIVRIILTVELRVAGATDGAQHQDVPDRRLHVLPGVRTGDERDSARWAGGEGPGGELHPAGRGGLEDTHRRQALDLRGQVGNPILGLQD
jgi:hypothetical protein